MRCSLFRTLLALGLLVGSAGHYANAQNSDLGVSAIAALDLPDAPEPQPRGGLPERFTILAADAAAGDELSFRSTPKRLLVDEARIVTSPVRLRARDLRWLIPLGAATAATLATDTHVMRDVVSHDSSFNSANDTTSSVIRDGFIAVPVALFGAGEIGGSEHQREAGLLAGEAMINAYATDLGIKYFLLRQRPKQDNARGHFFSGGAASDPSFVSGHSMVAWSSAAALAGEYSKPWQQVMLYGFAGSVSLTRVLAQQHFPTDVLLGSASGWLIGHYVFRSHHRDLIRQ